MDILASTSAQASGSSETPDFNRIAPLYRWLEYLSFGPLLQRCRLQLLPNIFHCRRALILGDGDGRFTARLLQVNPDIEVTAIDGSERMVQSLRRRAASHANRVTTQVADIRAWSPETLKPFDPPYDLIVSHFFLDCLTTHEITDLALRLKPSLAPGALWLVSEFAIPLSLFGRVFAAPLIALLYRAFGLLTNLQRRSLPDHPEALMITGWDCKLRHTRVRGLLVSELWQLL
jgi:Methyltransferase domain